ncbi:sulfatase family protein [Roseimaritima ulvae]|uniref:Arylsulfatase n=1 Tax=Roseimaritima ulvae TaxID=980254 RepID=A0A5B9QN64_9BACT|nr:sulfatase-like hydrolase/transferase [Roseimaritima ulvae]QEG38456.1 Arylsulfatase [Roseimaritima ulvae]
MLTPDDRRGLPLSWLSRVANVSRVTLVLCFVGALLTQAMDATSVRAADSERPNVILILADDLGYGDLACQGAADIQTPHLDQLFAQGLTLERFYANCCVCSPTRASVMSGCYPDRVGVPGVIRTRAENSWGYFQLQRETLPSVLADAGYKTAAIGKWHLGLEPENHPLSRGFESFHGFLGDMMDDYYNHRRHGINYMRSDRDEIDPPGHATDLFSQWAVEFIEQQRDGQRPWMMYLAYNAPHTPIQPPEDWKQKVLKRQPGIDPQRAALVALIEHMDAGIGRVLAALDQTEQTQDTLVIFTSDNGGQLSVGANNGKLRGGKGMMYEGGLRVPCCIRWPGRSRAGTRTQRLASTVDLLPTICKAAGLAAPEDLDGQSLLPLLENENANWPQREIYFVRREGGNQFGGLTIQAVRQGSWKLLQNTPYEPMQLFDLENDPLEQNDLSGKQRKRFNELSARLRLHVQNGGKVPWQK